MLSRLWTTFKVGEMIAKYTAEKYGAQPLGLDDERKEALREALAGLTAPGVTLKLKVHKRTYTCSVDASEKRIGFANMVPKEPLFKGVSLK